MAMAIAPNFIRLCVTWTTLQANSVTASNENEQKEPGLRGDRRAEEEGRLPKGTQHLARADKPNRQPLIRQHQRRAPAKQRSAYALQLAMTSL